MVTALLQARLFALLCSLIMLAVIVWYWKGWKTNQLLSRKVFRLIILFVGIMFFVLIGQRAFRAMTGFSLGDDLIATVLTIIPLVFGLGYGFLLVKSNHDKNQ